MNFFIVVIAAVMIFSGTAQAGGLIGDLVNNVVPGAGTALDDAHRQIKNAIPPYKQAEEATSGAVQHLSQEVAVESAGPALAGWIQASRADVINAGVAAIPPQIVAQLQGYFPSDLLSSIRYRVGWGNELALPANAYRFGDATAITLIDVVMFRDSNEAQSNVHLWAHELTHALQYRSWGLLDFAKRYVRDYRSVESDAENNAQRYSIWLAQRNQSFVQTSVISPQTSNICRTHAGGCLLPVFGPIGVSCWCGTPYGPVWGSVMR